MIRRRCIPIILAMVIFLVVCLFCTSMFGLRHKLGILESKTTTEQAVNRDYYMENNGEMSDRIRDVYRDAETSFLPATSIYDRRLKREMIPESTNDDPSYSDDETDIAYRSRDQDFEFRAATNTLIQELKNFEVLEKMSDDVRVGSSDDSEINAMEIGLDYRDERVYQQQLNTNKKEFNVLFPQDPVQFSEQAENKSQGTAITTVPKLEITCTNHSLYNILFGDRTCNRSKVTSKSQTVLDIENVTRFSDWKEKSHEPSRKTRALLQVMEDEQYNGTKWGFATTDVSMDGHKQLFADYPEYVDNNATAEEIVWTIPQKESAKLPSNFETNKIVKNVSDIAQIFRGFSKTLLSMPINAVKKDTSLGGAWNDSLDDLWNSTGTNEPTFIDLLESGTSNDEAVSANGIKKEFRELEKTETLGTDKFFSDAEEASLELANENLSWQESSTKKQRRENYNIEISKRKPRIKDGKGIHTFWRGGGIKDAIRQTQAAIMKRYMDTTVDPCQDFYQYACGNWSRHHPIPKDKGGYDTFELLRESLDEVLREILEESFDYEKQKISTNDAKIKAKYLYQSCMDYDILEKLGEKPLLKLLDDFGGWPIITPNWNTSKFDLITLMAKLRLYNNDILISEWVGPDIKNSDEYIIQFDQTTLGLPTREHFLQPSNAKYLNAYKSLMIHIATLLGAPTESATVQAYEIIAFETKLASLTSSPDQRRNVSALYQRMSVSALRKIVPQFDWYTYLDLVLARPVRVDEPVVVFALKYVRDMIQLVSETPSRIIANYLLWRFVRHRVSNLDDRFQEAKQRFYLTVFGREQSPPRWKTCVSQVNSNMGMALGAMFVDKYFDEDSKNDTLYMTLSITRSFRELLGNTSWIDEDTKRIALWKVGKMLLRIGYPDFILDQDELNRRYQHVEITPTNYFDNTLNILRHITRIEQDRIGHVVNKTQWSTAPAVVNAYYSRNKNQIIFPAGILQPPFYHRYFPKSLNYGGIGVVIGHEITHGFDDKGRLFDHHGNLHRWWTDSAIEGFHQRAQCLIDQYSQYIVPDVNLAVDGVNTQGENIADNGGIKQAYIAYHRWLDKQSDVDELLPGMNATNDQLFFLNYAQVWCGSTRPETARNKQKTTVHAPGKYRVIGTLSNSREFARAYDCPLDSAMNPEHKCSVW